MCTPKAPGCAVTDHTKTLHSKISSGRERMTRSVNTLQHLYLLENGGSQLNRALSIYERSTHVNYCLPKKVRSDLKASFFSPNALTDERIQGFIPTSPAHHGMFSWFLCGFWAPRKRGGQDSRVKCNLFCASSHTNHSPHNTPHRDTHKGKLPLVYETRNAW